MASSGARSGAGSVQGGALHVLDREDPQTGGSRMEEGSILDAAVGIGRMIDGR